MFEPANTAQKIKRREKPLTDLLRMIGKEQEGHRLRRVAEALFRRAEEGDIAAVKEIGDRLDGKAVQAISNDDGEALRIVIEKDDAKLL